MESLAIQKQGEQFIIQFSQKEFNQQFWLELYRQLRMEFFPQASELTQDDIDLWTEEIESNWYKIEGKPFLLAKGIEA